VPESGRPGKAIEITVENQAGLHGRPGSVLVRTAAGFRSEVLIENLTRGSAPANAKSHFNILAGGVRKGHVIRVTASGEDQDAAIDAIRALAAGGFGEGEAVAGEISQDGADSTTTAAAARESATTPALPTAAFAPAPVPQRVGAQAAPAVPGNRLAGKPGAAGIATGPVWVYRDARTTPTLVPGATAVPATTAATAVPATTAAAAAAAAAPAEHAASAPDAASVIRAAAAKAVDQLETLAERVRESGRLDDAEILGAQAVMASDPALLDGAVARAAAGESPATAVEAAAADLGAVLSDLPDESLAARAADVRDVGARIARILRGEDASLPSVPSIAVADDLPPSIAAEIPAGLLLGIALEGGSATAHTVILARGMGIPAIVGARGLVEAVSSATTIAMDGGSGEIALDPGPDRLAGFAARAAALAARRRDAVALRDRPAATSDGSRVILLANIGGPADTARALEMRAEGVGLFRTEFLFMQRRTAPSEAEQVEPYRRVFEAFGPDRPVVVRLADIGGDKAMPYLDLPPEANPFLGVRAIRLAGRNRELLSAQLRAIWRAAARAGVTPHVMAPMVATIADVELLLELRDEARAVVAASGEALPERMVTGVMIEIPAAAILARKIARRVDFFSIGTNDLTQYAMAADRSNPELAYLQDALHPAVLKLIAGVVAGAAEAGIPTAVCGELAGDPAGALVLAGLGVGELSADAGSLDGIRAALAGVARNQLRDLGERALAAADASAVRSMATELLV
jgi:phosphoenolpyruvate-protein phosphotransferase